MQQQVQISNAFAFPSVDNHIDKEQITYHATEIQLEGDRSQLLYVLNSGNWDERTEICGIPIE